jgi:hypothetical protein
LYIYKWKKQGINIPAFDFLQALKCQKIKNFDILNKRWYNAFVFMPKRHFKINKLQQKNFYQNDKMILPQRQKYKKENLWRKKKRSFGTFSKRTKPRYFSLVFRF